MNSTTRPGGRHRLPRTSHAPTSLEFRHSAGREEALLQLKDAVREGRYEGQLGSHDPFLLARRGYLAFRRNGSSALDESRLLPFRNGETRA